MVTVVLDLRALTRGDRVLDGERVQPVLGRDGLQDVLVRFEQAEPDESAVMRAGQLEGLRGGQVTGDGQLRQPWGYPAVLAVIALVCGALFRAFRRNGWL